MAGAVTGDAAGFLPIVEMDDETHLALLQQRAVAAIHAKPFGHGGHDRDGLRLQVGKAGLDPRVGLGQQRGALRPPPGNGAEAGEMIRRGSDFRQGEPRAEGGGADEGLFRPKGRADGMGEPLRPVPHDVWRQPPPR